MAKESPKTDPKDSKIRGRCHCGSVQFKSNGDVRLVLNCHCNMCRKMNGTAFSSYVVIPKDVLEFEGEEGLASYFVTGDASKHFCVECGTPVFNTNVRYPGLCMMYLGSIDGHRDFEPALNIYCENMLSWTDNIESIQALPQGVDKQS